MSIHTQKYLTTGVVVDTIEKILIALKDPYERKFSAMYASSISVLCFVCLDEDTSKSLSPELNGFLDKMIWNIENNRQWLIRNEIHTQLVDKEKYEILVELKKRELL